MKEQRVIIESIRYITGNQKSVKIKGKIEEVKAFQEVLNASKKLYENLQKDNVRLSVIEKLVARKNQAAKKFYKITGTSWPF